MRDNKIIHREEAYLGAMEATISYSIVGKGRESVVYDDLDKLDMQWKPYGNGLVKSQNGPRTAKIEIKVFYQDGRGQRVDKYCDLAVFKRHWQSKTQFFKWEGPKG